MIRSSNPGAPDFNELTRAIAENSVHGLVIMDERGYCLYANPRWMEMTGLTREDLRTRTVHDLVHYKRPDGRPLPIEACPIGCTPGKNQSRRNHEDVFFRKDGTPFHVSCSASPVSRDGQPIMMILETRDITAEKQAKQRLLDSEEMFRSTFEQAAVGIAHVDANGRFLRVNRQLCDMLGYSQDEMHALTFMDITHADDHDASRVIFLHLINGARDITIDKRYIRRDGNLFWVKVTVSAVRDADGGFKYTVAVIEDISARKADEETLRLAAKRKDEFLAMLGHELRNPLSPIITASELLDHANVDGDVLKRMSAIIVRQARHLTGLVDDLLDVSRITRGAVVLDKTPQDIDAIVASAVEQTQPLIDERRHRLSLRAAPEAAQVLGDQKRLIQVVANLLNNAAKYTPERGAIQLATEVSDSNVTLHVVDNGIGIRPDHQQLVFELFAQAERSLDRAQGGLGLGLALVKSLVEAHGGTVSCHSDGVGRGSRFSVVLPRLARNGGDLPDKLGRSAWKQQRPLDILVADDNVDVAETLAMYLEAAGHRPVVEFDAVRAFDVAVAKRPDICILDIGMPRLDGYEMARRIRMHSETWRPLLVAITGYGQEHDRAAALAAGFDHHFVKPVDLDALVAAIRA
ncbi:PAS domain-containing hybrid sensor histidine kinase/response regulator [Noviherbaspirillum denitrificans]|uniref:histidine kinase n=1 Tax=Noviherbaspirillum denitrificans TaxID=1968433 RepID=A0A254TGC2_9BURK|nr:PAS domain S-box protein [Noviherbaspirillum denitrificans]OWW19583.1 hypothetical protein AYR66_08700 [Noviherbaspirillum denitrificans]